MDDPDPLIVFAFEDALAVIAPLVNVMRKANSHCSVDSRNESMIRDKE